MRGPPPLPSRSRGIPQADHRARHLRQTRRQSPDSAVRTVMNTRTGATSRFYHNSERYFHNPELRTGPGGWSGLASGQALAQGRSLLDSFRRNLGMDVSSPAERELVSAYAVDSALPTRKRPRALLHQPLLCSSSTTARRSSAPAAAPGKLPTVVDAIPAGWAAMHVAVHQPARSG